MFTRKSLKKMSGGNFCLWSIRVEYLGDRVEVERDFPGL